MYINPAKLYVIILICSDPKFFPAIVMIIEPKVLPDVVEIVMMNPIFTVSIFIPPLIVLFSQFLGKIFAIKVEELLSRKYVRFNNNINPIEYLIQFSLNVKQSIPLEITQAIKITTIIFLSLNFELIVLNNRFIGITIIIINFT